MGEILAPSAEIVDEEKNFSVCDPLSPPCHDIKVHKRARQGAEEAGAPSTLRNFEKSVFWGKKSAFRRVKMLVNNRHFITRHLTQSFSRTLTLVVGLKVGSNSALAPHISKNSH